MKKAKTLDKKIPKKSIKDLIIDFFNLHPSQDFEHGPVVDYVEEKYKKLYGKKPRDTWRSIRNLHEQGFLIKVRKGIYRFDASQVQKISLEEFSAEQKDQILQRDGFKCAVCGKGKRDGVELHIDHIKPKSLGGKAIIENGQILCAQHNFMKKSLKQTETGKKMFINLLKLAEKEGDLILKSFCEDILKTFEAHGINGHIEWKK